MTSQDTKECRVCGEEKYVTDFYHRNKKEGTYRHDCKECVKERSAKQEYDSGYFRAHHLMKTYGITLEQYDEMLEAQDGGCAICKTTDPRGKGRFHVDHCHDTGAVRGLLCQTCNQGIGLLQDSIDVLLDAAKYLGRHK